MRYFIELSYNGKNYHGWQIQPNAVSVQAVVQEVLSKLLRKDISVMAAGRTDTGVHAKQIFVHIDVETFQEAFINTPNFLFKVNSFLPKDIAVKNFFKVKPNIHARFDAVKRSYQYHLALQKNPFSSETSWQILKFLNVKKMNEAALILLEYTNFKSFSRSKTDVKTYDCTIFEAIWKQTDNQLVFYITANRFLRNMVRAIVGTLVAVGLEKITITQFREIIECQDRTKAGVSAPAQGLFLTKVAYPKTIVDND